MALTPEQQAAIDRVRGTSQLTADQQAAIARVRQSAPIGEPNIQPGTVPTQNVRMVLQGATLENADEWEARLRSMAGEDYNTALDDIRSKVADFKSSNPKAAFVEEAAGAMLPSAGAVMATKNPASAAPAMARLFPNLAKVAGLGAVEGAVTGYGASEGRTAKEKLSDPIGLATSAVIGAAIPAASTPVLMGAAKLAGGVTDLVNRAVGTKAKDMVSAEVQRIVKQAGMTEDEIVEKIANGEILAENPVIRGDVRAMKAKGGSAADIIQKVMADRPDNTALEAGKRISSGLGAGMDQNTVKIARMQDNELQKLERIEYQDVFKDKEIAKGSVNNAMMDVIKRAPNAGKKLQDAFRSASGEEPFFTVKNGKVEFITNPTLQDAEYLRRVVYEMGNEGVEKGGVDGQIGINMLRAEDDLRAAIDKQSDKLKGVRENAALRREISGAFKSGESILLKSPEAAQLEFNAIEKRGEMVLDSFRLGYLAKIRSSMAAGNRKGLMSRLNDETSKEGIMFRTIFPGDKLDDALSKIGVAAQSRAAATKILLGSDTAETLARGALSGSNISTSEVAQAIRLEPVALYNITSKLVQQFAPKLSDQQKAQVARVLLSEDPKFVIKALNDKSALGSLKQKIDNLSGSPYMTAALAMSVPANERINK